MPEYDMPPPFLVPKDIADAQRREEVKDAIIRYVKQGYRLPQAWIDEYNESEWCAKGVDA